MASTAALELLIQLKDEASKGVTALGKNVDKLGKGMDSAKKTSGGFFKGMGGGVGQVAALATGIGGVVAVGGLMTDFFSDAMSEAEEAQAGMAQLEAVLKSTGDAVGMTKDELLDLSEALSASNGMSKFSDDAVLAGENLLLTFTNIGQEVFPMATQAMVDMAQAMGTDVKGGAIQLGKALNDPVAGISALSRVGVTFTSQQRDMIQAMVDAGDVAGAQKIILAELGKEFGGSALAAAQTFEGRMNTLSEAFNGVKQSVGEALMPVLESVIGWLTSPEVLAGIQNVALGLVDGIGHAVEFIGQVAQTVGPIISDFMSGLFGGETSTQAGVFGAALRDGIAGAITWLSDTIATVGPVIMEFIGGLFGGDTTTQAGQFGATVRDVVVTALQTLYDIVTTIGPLVGDFIKGLFGGETTTAAGALGNTLNTVLVPAFQTLGTTIGDASTSLGDFWTGLTGGAAEGSKEVFSEMNGDVIDLRTSWEKFGDDTRISLEKSKADWDVFWTNQEQSLSKSKTDWDAFWTASGQSFESTFHITWQQFWNDTGQSLSKSRSDWDAFWLATGQGFERSFGAGSGWAKFWNDMGTELAASKVDWDAFWKDSQDSFNKSFGQDSGWSTFWATQDQSLSKSKSDWDAFWTATGQSLEKSKSDWDVFWGDLGRGIEKTKSDWNAFWTALGQGIANASKKIDELWQNIRNAIADLIAKAPGQAREIGVGIVNGIIAGVQSMGGALGGALATLVQGALNAAKNALGIKSPSLVTRRELGMPMIEGVIEGIELLQPRLNQSLSGAMAGCVQVAKDAAPQMGSAVGFWSQEMRDSLTDISILCGEGATEIVDSFIQPIEDATPTFADTCFNFGQAGAKAMSDGFVPSLHMPQGAFAPIQSDWIRDTLPMAEFWNGTTTGGGRGGILAAKGFHGWVNGPTPILAGEAGSEYVSITPRSQMGGSGGFNFNITVNASGGADGRRIADEIVDRLSVRQADMHRLMNSGGRS